jgi:hypothetical protein
MGKPGKWPLAGSSTYMDFLCGCTLHEMVCPSSTFTHRTMYDCFVDLRVSECGSSGS